MYESSIIFGRVSEIESLADEWRELCDEGACGEPFFRPEWFQAYLTNFESEILLITVRNKGRLRAVLPLIKGRTSMHGLPLTTLGAASNLNTPRFGLIHGTDEAECAGITKAIWQELCKVSAWHAIELRLVKQDSWLNDLVKEAADDHHQTGVWKMDAAPFIELPRSADGSDAIKQFFQGSRKHFGRELDRRERRINEVGNVRSVVTHDFSTDLIERYFDLELRGWKGRAGTASVQDTYSMGLHRDFARSAAENGTLHAYELMLDDTTIAMSLNILAGSTMYHWRTSYDEAYSKYSPGNLLFRKLFFDCIDNGVGEIDFLSPSTPNKRAWSTGEREHVAFCIFRPGVAGHLGWAWKFMVISRLRKFKAEQPAVIERLHRLAGQVRALFIA
jgi:CelD/BcsL family acetyltransferase involved in cellulose biosynthesis